MPVTEAGTHSLTLEFGGRTRSYELYVPAAHFEGETAGAPRPLVFILHGATGRGRAIQARTDFDLLAEREGFFAVYPNGLGGVWNDGREGDPRLIPTDDVAFLLAVLDQVSEMLPVDPARVYAAGYSMGGMMAFRAACEAPDRFRAVASVAATLPEYLVRTCAAAPPIPVLLIHGTSDTQIPWDGAPAGGQGYLSAFQTADFWIEHNNCTRRSALAALPDVDPADGTRVVIGTASDCDEGAAFALYAIYGGGHTWPRHPSAVNTDEVTSRDIDANAVIWSFFSGL